jgi:hypothetical protein
MAFIEITHLNHTTMINKKIFKRNRALQVLKAAPLFLLLLLQGNTALAQQTTPAAKQDEFPYVEVFGSIAAIFVLIVIAWMIGAKQSKPEPPSEYHPANARRQFNHPNDPHFRKIKRKTS